MKPHIKATVYLAVAIFLASWQPAFAVEVHGAPSWLVPVVGKSLDAVWEEVPYAKETLFRENVLSVVVSRLFLGYSLVSGDRESVQLKPAPAPVWSVRITTGEWSQPVSEWIKEDTHGLSSDIAAMLDGVPVEVFSWGDQAFREHVLSMLEQRLPGWDAAITVRPNPEGQEVEVYLRPAPPLVLAMNPSISSTTLPTIFQSELKEELLISFAPFVGVPLPYFERHGKGAEEWIGQTLERRYVVQQTDGVTKVDATAEQVSKVHVDLESRKYTIWAWAAGYGGTKDKSTELGLHFGRKTTPWSGLSLEVYGELILAASDWNLESRWGARWSPWGDLWLGAELVYPGGEVWWKAQIVPKLNNPYAWARFSMKGESQLALGWRFTEHISVEILRDSRDRDEWSLRAVGNL